MQRIALMGSLIMVLNLFFLKNTAAQNWVQKNNNLTNKYKRFVIPKKLKEGIDFQSHKIVLKIHPDYKKLIIKQDIQHAQFNEILNALGEITLKQLFPNEDNLNSIYELTYSSSENLQTVLDKIGAIGIFSYVEPKIIPKIALTVNDPYTSLEYAIRKVKADSAWNYSKGDTSIVIGIVDTGTEPDHPDLLTHIKHNYHDTIDGIDNDGDGYIDNFSGWDLGMNDNNPTWQGDPHGVHVSGIAAATTNNNLGIASVGFNCTFLPVKVADSTGTLVAAYEGILYAATHGCKIINCSWGESTGGQYGLDIINTAIYKYDALIVAAAGNSGTEGVLYPGAYPNVLSIAATDSNDLLAAFSSYGYGVSLCAPGENIYSTWSLNGGSYIYNSGTSMSAPCVAGGAGLLRAHFPSYTALQIAAQLKASADSLIYTLPSNSSYINKLGTGRLNLLHALTDTSLEAISLTSIKVLDNVSTAFLPGDTLAISGVFTNLLAPVSNVQVSISSDSPYILIIPANSQFLIPSMKTLGVDSNDQAPFKLVILPNTPTDTIVTIKITYRNNQFTSYQYTSINVHLDYLNCEVNNISTTITDKGDIGWDNSPPTLGLGFQYQGINLQYDGGLLIGVPDSSVSNVLRGLNLNNDQDFVPLSSIQRIGTGSISAFDTEGLMNDADAQTPLGITIHHHSYAWSTNPNQNYIMYKYIILNNSQQTLQNMYAGICIDWDIQDPEGNNNKTSFDTLNRMAYSWYTGTNGIYAGIKLLSKTAGVSAYGIDNIPGGAGGIDIYEGFSKRQKYIALSTMRPEAGVSGSGDDILDLLSTGPITLNPGDSVETTFALLASNSLALLQSSANSAQIQYDNNLLNVNYMQNQQGIQLVCYPNPSNRTATVSIEIPDVKKLTLKVINLVGQSRELYSFTNLSQGNYNYQINTSTLINGIYFIQLTVDESTITRKLIVANN